MISGIGSGGTFGAGTQPAARNNAEPLRTNSARIPANAGPSEEPLSRPRPPGPTEVDGPQVWGNGYLSPVYRFDDSTSTLFFEQRAFVSGDTTRQVPLESAVKLYSLFEQVRQSTLPGQSGEAETAGQGDPAPVPTASGRETPEATATGQTEAATATGGTPQPAPAETAPIRQPSSATAGPVGQLLDIEA
ncbi:hypothetical protein [Oceanibaculum sp.]|uniref:hypothetical protein n=1 Tax=Oceanibaculum sp. TaxID=1903597 RepID=UPI002586C02B|nr:hypothetical protein [Oceanibaculum sp.]MCH2394905.1 hypothetical protein [Oceanibaculum sp.]